MVIGTNVNGFCVEDMTGRGLGNPHLFIIVINLRRCGIDPVNISLPYTINPVFLGLLMEYSLPFQLNTNPGDCVGWFFLDWVILLVCDER